MRRDEIGNRPHTQANLGNRFVMAKTGAGIPGPSKCYPCANNKLVQKCEHQKLMPPTFTKKGLLRLLYKNSGIGLIIELDYEEKKQKELRQGYINRKSQDQLLRYHKKE